MNGLILGFLLLGADPANEGLFSWFFTLEIRMSDFSFRLKKIDAQLDVNSAELSRLSEMRSANSASRSDNAVLRSQLSALRSELAVARFQFEAEHVAFQRSAVQTFGPRYTR